MTAEKEQLTVSELMAARDFLRQADMLLAGVRTLFFNIGDFTTAARLGDILARLADEIHAVERQIARGNGGNGGQP